MPNPKLSIMLTPCSIKLQIQHVCKKAVSHQLGFLNILARTGDAVVGH